MAPVRLTVDQALYLRLRGQGLISGSDGSADPAAAERAARLTAGLQAQDLFAASLGVRVRARGAVLADFEHSRLVDRSIVRTWLMRGTLHVVPAADLDWYVAVAGPSLVAATARRRAEIGLDDDTYARGLAVVLDTLSTNGPALREEIGAALAAAGLPHGYSVERHLLFRAALEGRICFGEDRGDVPGSNPTFVLLEQWLGRPLTTLNGDELRSAATRLTERYLQAFAPATLVDFSTWSGLNIRELRDAWDSLRPGLVEVEVSGQKAYLPESRLTELDEPPPPTPFVRLLPAFDTYILGHRSRSLIDDGAYAARYKGGGMLPPMVLVDGRVRGAWQTNRKGRRVAITVDPFEPLPAEVERGIAEEITDIERFLKT